MLEKLKYLCLFIITICNILIVVYTPKYNGQYENSYINTIFPEKKLSLSDKSNLNHNFKKYIPIKNERKGFINNISKE